jgi:hypothetical protein
LREVARPQLSYVFAATSAEELPRVARWLWRASCAPEIEVVLAAPARLPARTAARVVPRRANLASSGGEDRIAVRRAGAAVTTGLVVIVIDCDEDFEARLQGPAAGASPGATSGNSPELARWAAELDLLPA